MKAIEPGLKIAITLRYLASDDKYRYLRMKFDFKVPYNTISLIIREVCQAIVGVHKNEVISCPILPDEWRRGATHKIVVRAHYEHYERSSKALQATWLRNSCVFRQS